MNEPLQLPVDIDHCSAHPLVLEAAIRYASANQTPLLIEATSNQVDQFGGYASGMSMPIGFKNATDGSIKPAADSCFAAAFEYRNIYDYS